MSAAPWLLIVLAFCIGLIVGGRIAVAAMKAGITKTTSRLFVALDAEGVPPEAIRRAVTAMAAARGGSEVQQ